MQGEGSANSAVQPDEPEAENRLRCGPCEKTYSRSDSLARHLRSESHLARMRGEVREAQLGRPTKDAQRKKSRERLVRRI